MALIKIDIRRHSIEKPTKMIVRDENKNKTLCFALLLIPDNSLENKSAGRASAHTLVRE